MSEAPYSAVLSMLGLGIEILGAFFLSVEAIKVDNLRILRDRWIRSAHRRTLSPRVIFEGSAGPPSLPRPSDHYPFLYMALHPVAGAALLAGIVVAGGQWPEALLLGIAAWWLSLAWYLEALMLPLIAVLGLLVLWLLGEVVHVAVEKSAWGLMLFVDWIDAHVPTGTVGILGFGLLLFGGVLQMLGLWLATAAND